MKNEQEFLEGMWLKVDILEREELEKAHAKALNRRITIKAIGTAIFTIISFLLATLYPQIIDDGVYPLTIGALFITFTFEYLSINRLGENNYGNYNM